MSWDLEEEVVVLQSMYGDEFVRVESPGPCGTIARLFVDIQPRVVQGAALVSVTLRIDLPVGYPTDATPQTSIERSRGLGDAASAALLAAASRAVEESGLQEVGCVSLLLDEASEALDNANEETECVICLVACRPGEATVRPLCEHVCHAACIGRWAAIKAAEAESEASEATRSTVNARDALERDLAEVGVRIADASETLEDAQQRASRRNRRLEVARAQMQKGYGSQNEADVMELLSDQEEEDAEPPTVEQLSELLRQARSKLKIAEAEEKKVRGRRADIASKLEEVQSKLNKQKDSLAAASLPCPVCRESIERRLLPDASNLPAAVIQPASKANASIRALPRDVQERVRQRQHVDAGRWARQQEHAATFESQEEQGASIPLGEGAREAVPQSFAGPTPVGSSAVPSSRASTNSGMAHVDRLEEGGRKGDAESSRHHDEGTSTKGGGSKGGTKGSGWSSRSGWGSGWESSAWWTSSAGWDGGGNAQKGGGTDLGPRAGRWRGRDKAARGAT